MKEGQAIDFRAAIIPVDGFRPPSTPPDAVTLEVAGDRSLRYGERTISVKPDLFALNALIMAQGKCCLRA